MYASERGVFSVLPFGIKSPDDVRIDGEQGVTRETYTRLLDSVETEITVRLDAGRVPTQLRRHKLIVQAADRLMAAQIARKMKSYQELANSLFADANIKLRLFFESVHGTPEGQARGNVPTVVVSQSAALTDTDFASSNPGFTIFR